MISINNFFYYTNYGVIQGFPALRKAVTTYVKKYDILFTCVWYRQSDTDMSHAFPPLGQVDEWTAKPSPFSIHGRLSEYFRINYGCYKTEISVLTLTDSEVQTFLETGENQNTIYEKLKVTYLVALVMEFLATENENRPLEDLPQDNFGRLPEWFFLSVRTNSITENFVYWKLGPLFVFVVIQRMFSSWVRQRTLRFVFWIVDPFIFIH